MKKTSRIFLFSILIALMAVLPLLPVLADAPDIPDGSLPPPSNLKTFEDLLGVVAEFLRLIGTPLGVLAILWSALLFMTAGGNEEKVTKAKQTLIWTVIGLAIILIGNGLVSVIKDLLDVTPTTTP